MSKVEELEQQVQDLTKENQALYEALMTADAEIKELKDQLMSLENIERLLKLKQIEAYDKVIQAIE